MCYIVWALCAFLYAPIFKLLYQSRWETIDYTHAYFILPVSLWLAWKQRKKLQSLARIAGAPRAAASGLNLALVIFGLFLYVFGVRQDYLFISTLSLIPLLFGLTGYLYTPSVSRALAFPILYLLLLVPPPLGVLDSLTLPMRHWISVITHLLLKALGYPITRDGLLLSISGNEIYMGAPCSGFRSLITMISLGLAYVYVIKASFRNKLILVCSVVPLALLGNLVRVVGMCLVTFYMGAAAGHTYHDASGFVIFLVLIAGMLGLEWLLEKKTARKEK